MDLPLYNSALSHDLLLYNTTGGHDSLLFYAAECFLKIANISTNSKPNPVLRNHASSVDDRYPLRHEIIFRIRIRCHYFGSGFRSGP
jgi:hypothetical protein